jgi:hypothetical protein
MSECGAIYIITGNARDVTLIMIKINISDILADADLFCKIMNFNHFDYL